MGQGMWVYVWNAETEREDCFYWHGYWSFSVQRLLLLPCLSINCKAAEMEWLEQMRETIWSGVLYNQRMVCASVRQDQKLLTGSTTQVVTKYSEIHWLSSLSWKYPEFGCHNQLSCWQACFWLDIFSSNLIMDLISLSFVRSWCFFELATISWSCLSDWCKAVCPVAPLTVLMVAVFFLLFFNLMFQHCSIFVF